MLFSISKEFKVRFFARHCILKFEIFCYKFWNKQNSDDVHWNVWTKVVRPKKYFRKLNYRYEILNQLYFGPSFVFWRTALGHFSQCFCFLIFCLWLTMVTDIFTLFSNLFFSPRGKMTKCEVNSHLVKAWKPINAFLLSSSISTSDIRTIFLPAPVPLSRIKLAE